MSGWSRWRALVLVAAWGAGCDGGATLTIVTRSSFAPGVDVITAQARVDGTARGERALAAGDPLDDGIEVAVIPDLAKGSHDVTVRLLDIDGVTVGQASTVVLLDRDRSVTLVIDGSALDAGMDDAGMDDAGMDDAGMDDAGIDGARMDGAGMDGAGMDGAGMDGAGMDGAGMDASGDAQMDAGDDAPTDTGDDPRIDTGDDPRDASATDSSWRADGPPPDVEAGTGG